MARSVLGLSHLIALVFASDRWQSAELHDNQAVCRSDKIVDEVLGQACEALSPFFNRVLEENPPCQDSLERRKAPAFTTSRWCLEAAFSRQGF